MEDNEFYGTLPVWIAGTLAGIVIVCVVISLIYIFG